MSHGQMLLCNEALTRNKFSKFLALFSNYYQLAVLIENYIVYEVPIKSYSMSHRLSFDFSSLEQIFFLRINFLLIEILSFLDR